MVFRLLNGGLRYGRLAAVRRLNLLLDLRLTREQREMVSSVASWAERHLSASYLAQCDEERAYPTKAMASLAEQGWTGLPVPIEYGGDDAAAVDLAVVHYALARHSLAIAQAFYSLFVLGAEAFARMGTEAQRATYLPGIRDGKIKVAFALTEPDSGSDSSALRTSARQEGDRFIVNGSKVFITGAAVSDIIITAVRTGTDGDRRAGISLLCIDPSQPGVSIRAIPKIGLKALDLCEVTFADVEVDASNLLGPLNGGWAALREGLAKERLFLAAISVGAMVDVLDRATSYASEREAFGRPIGDHQFVADKIVGIRRSVETAGSLVLDAARLVDVKDPNAAVAASLAKWTATEAYVSAARDGVQVFGGYGYTEEFPIARHYRDCKFLEIGGGTSEIQKIVIARSMGLRP